MSEETPKTPTVTEFELTDAEVANFRNFEGVLACLGETFRMASLHHSKEIRKIHQQSDDLWDEVVKRAGFNSVADMHFHGYEATADFKGDVYVVRIAEKDPWDNKDWPKKKK